DGSCDSLGKGSGNQDCTLREAINAANALSGVQTIAFDIPPGDSSCSAANVCTIMLSSTLPAISDASGLTIDGAGQNITISGNNAVRVVSVRSGSALAVKNLRIADGNADDGGGIFNGGTLTVNNSTFSNNSTGSGSG